MLIMLYLTKMLIKYKSPYHRLQLSLKIKVMKVNYALYSNQLIINPKINEIKRSNHEAKEWKSLLCHKIQQGLKRREKLGTNSFGHRCNIYYIYEYGHFGVQIFYI